MNDKMRKAVGEEGQTS